jgi:hypothetical protein
MAAKAKDGYCVDVLTNIEICPLTQPLDELLSGHDHRSNEKIRR